jgi:hypothetical protein
VETTSSNPDDTREYQADKETWSPLTGGINSGKPANQCEVAPDADPPHKISSSAPQIACHPAIRNQAPPDDGSEEDGGWVLPKDPYIDDRDGPDSDDSEERRRNCSLCYNRVRCYCTQNSDSGD